MQQAAGAPAAPGPPLWLLAELTYRCPLHCVFCFNPLEFAARQEEELTTEDWVRVLRQGRELGAVQLGLSGGEPLVRDDLEAIVAEAHRLGYYTNLLTSGVGLSAARAEALKAAGLDHVQLSFQDSTREMNDFLSHTKTFDLKSRVARLIKDQGWPMVMNVVIHRMNIDHIDRIIGMAAEMGAEYLELANTQYYSWAFLNREHLLPTREQLLRAEKITDAWRARMGERMRIFFVAPDYHEGKAKKCVNGWGSTLLSVAPDGTALPCHTAKMLPGLQFPNVRDNSLREIWFESEGFNRYRGTGWMKEPCSSCDMREVDLGGCRCQAYLLAQDPALADPVCIKSPHHHLVEEAVSQAEAAAPLARVTEHPLVFRDPANSRRLASAPR
ncbi:pyrroloquinoline quinone biosynthesis protein PqqE [Variovorax sp. OV329]|uniref:pyrroloquinoline quinone biosynthesis protein PqqE n=1 Tax=Variovorax sp. OV329 TaxID=1882825 RepID=UPI0008EC5F5C|nr:pyrroloquinoline quinone biosynthesis protein PqqE [Variovorax sp. OV329]SFL95858.1 pyrroloquinoline quinone biosynthesis protein E [Variovorax sp. OV329]